MPLSLAPAVGRRAFVRRGGSAGVVGASFRLVLFTIPLVDVDFVVVVCCSDAEGPWSKVIGGTRLMGQAAAPLVPNCFVGEDGSVPIVAPWELGGVS